MSEYPPRIQYDSRHTLLVTGLTDHGDELRSVREFKDLNFALLEFAQSVNTPRLSWREVKVVLTTGNDAESTILASFQYGRLHFPFNRLSLSPSIAQRYNVNKSLVTESN